MTNEAHLLIGIGITIMIEGVLNFSGHSISIKKRGDYESRHALKYF